MNWLIDTNVISESRRAKPSQAVAQWIASIELRQSFTSDMVLAELVYGAALVDDIPKRMALQSWIDGVVRIWFHGRILPIDEAILVRWRVIRREREVLKEPAPAVDLLIAATAIENGLGVATRDTAPFVATGLPVLNPFTGERFNGA
jgi:toxin FitB